jgi:hypothetical protein
MYESALSKLRLKHGKNEEYGYQYEPPDQTWKARVNLTQSRINGIWAESLANEKSDSEHMQKVRRMREDKRKFGSSGLDEVKLEALVNAKIKKLRPEIAPIDRLRFNSMSEECKKLLYKHKSRTLRKFDPALQRSFAVE